MSLKYVDHNGAAHDIAGLSPGGNIEYGAVTTRTGTKTTSSISPSGHESFFVQFSEAMPDADYCIDLRTVDVGNVSMTVYSKSASGFNLNVYNLHTNAQTVTITYTAFKLYTVAEAEQLASAVDDIEAMIPASASSSNKFATVGDLSTETRSLDRRIDTLEDAVPVGTSISNQLINQTQLTNAIENVEIDVDDALDSTSENPVQNKVIANALQNVEIDVDSSISGTSENPVQNKVIKAALDKKEDVQFTGTKAEWDALSTAEKKEYKIANITDDVIGGEVADVVADGDMRPITSNAVYNQVWKKADHRVQSNSTGSAAGNVLFNHIENGSCNFLVGNYRSPNASNYDGYCIIKVYNNTAYISNKVGLESMSVSYDSTNKRLIIDSVAYMNYLLTTQFIID